MENLSIKERFLMLGSGKMICNELGHIYEIKDNMLYFRGLSMSVTTDLLDPNHRLTEYIDLQYWNWALEQMQAGKKVRWHEWHKNTYIYKSPYDIIIYDDCGVEPLLNKIRYFTEKGWVLYEG